MFIRSASRDCHRLPGRRPVQRSPFLRVVVWHLLIPCRKIRGIADPRDYLPLILLYALPRPLNNPEARANDSSRVARYLETCM